MEGALRWLRSVVVGTAVVAQQAVVSLRYNWGLGLLSLVLALSLWVYVTDRENPDVSGRVPGSVPVEAVNVPAGQAVVSLSQASVTVEARASESVFDRLTAEDFRATVDLSGVTSQQATVHVQVESQEPRAEVVEARPAQVTVRLEPVTSRTVPVRAHLVGALPRGFELRDVTVDPAEALAIGPESLVDLVEAVEADVNLTGVQSDFEQTLLLQARGARGNIEGIEVEPDSATVSVDVEQLIFTSGFVVRPEVAGAPAEGYNVTAVEVNPPLVLVSGTTEALQSIDAVAGISTEVVSIEGATADVVRPVALQLPEGVTVSRPDVTVTVRIAPAQGQLSFSVAPRPTGLGSGLQATVTPATVQVALAGAVPDLQALQAQQISATVDLSGLGAGEHTVPVRLQAPGGTLVVSASPPEVRVTVR